jgi:hypothetical protein
MNHPSETEAGFARSIAELILEGRDIATPVGGEIHTCPRWLAAPSIHHGRA